MQFKTVGVLGAGIMGSGIAEVCARHGLSTLVFDIGEAPLEAGKRRIEKSLGRAKDAGKLSAAEAESTLERISFTLELEQFSRCDVVVEAVVENLEQKVQLFSRLDRIVPAHALLASNTSALPLIEIAAATSRPDRVVGLHFFNPAPVMKLLEVVRSIVTSQETMDDALAFGKLLEKEAIIAQDRGGFIVNLLLLPYLTNAIRMFESGFASREDIDTGMKLGCGHPMGPMELLDYIGLDTTLMVCEALHKEYGQPEYAPPPLLKRMVAAGQLGRKSGKGFYEYSSSRAPQAAGVS